jgi:hypothetical protein
MPGIMPGIHVFFQADFAVVTDENGVVMAHLSFDAWGKRFSCGIHESI